MNKEIKIRILIQNAIGFAVGFALMYAISFLMDPGLGTNDRAFLKYVLIDGIVAGGIGGLVCGLTLLFVLYKYVIPKDRKGGEVLAGWIFSLIVGLILLKNLDADIIKFGLRSDFTYLVIYAFSLFFMGFIGGISTLYFLSKTIPDNIMILFLLCVLWSFGSGIAGLLAYILQRIVFSLIQLTFPISQSDWSPLVQLTINGAIVGSLMGLIAGFVVLRYNGNLTKAISNL